MSSLNKENLKEPTSPIYVVAKDNVILPIDGKQNKRLPESIYGTQGWDEGLPFDCSTVNYIWNNHGSWIDYLNKQRPVDLDAINKRIDDLNKKHTEDTKTANTRMTAMQIKVGGYYFGGSANPATHLLYGTWSKVEADLTLRSAATDGETTGNNDPSVPLKGHKHDITINNGGAHTPTATQTPHGHRVLGTTQIGGSTDPLAGTAIAGEFDGGNAYALNGREGQPFIKEVSPTITVNRVTDHNHMATCKETGEDSPTLDVRGKYIPCVIWKRAS